MRTCTKNFILLPWVLIVPGLILAGRLPAQTFKTIHSFTDVINSTNSDGASPVAGLVLSGNTVYGTAPSGGSSVVGTVFAVSTDGTGFTTLHSFSDTSGSFPLTNSDGASPTYSMVLSGNTLYGTASQGGSLAGGTVFAINTDGTGFTTLHNFNSSSDGSFPYAGVILSGNTLFGTARYEGISGGGTVFAVNTNGTDFTTLHGFLEGAGGFHINDDGFGPLARLSLSSNVLYGTTVQGGSAGQGVVFAVNTDGTGFLNLHTFPARSGSPSTNSEGANPGSGVILSGNTLYGTASIGGRWAQGTVFAVNTDGAGFTNLHSFSATSSSSPYTNSDGANPRAGLLLSGNTLYGTANAGGRWGNGTVFSLKTDGTGFTTLHSFAATSGPYPATNSQGANPRSELIMSGNTLYGTAFAGGRWGRGTVFSLSFEPKLKITPSGTNIVLAWPTNYAGFDYTGYTLQFATNLVPPATWSTVSPPPAIVNGQYTVTNPASGIQRFYRLIQ